jgi:orotate phosphoribosyltransferase
MDPFGSEEFAETSLSASVLNAAKVLEDANFSVADVIAILLQKERDTRVKMPYSLARVRELQDTLDRVTL